MLTLLKKYTDKLISQRLADLPNIVYLARDDTLYSYPADTKIVQTLKPALQSVFDRMNINSLLFSVPEEPYKSILNSLLRWGTISTGRKKKILPQDCETRTFFHDIPVIDKPTPDNIVNALSGRKSAIIAEGPSVVSYGSVSPEQASVSFSSTCFSTFVKYFYDHLIYLDECRERNEVPETERIRTFDSIRSLLDEEFSKVQLAEGHPQDEESIIDMLSEAGNKVVEEKLVDSYFGNISFFTGDKIFISETAASLDELRTSIDIVPLDGSSSVGITASSEVSTHRKVFERTKARAILHGHPKFSVIMSMYCNKDCDSRDECHKACPEKRSICETPVVSGEIGTGPTGIVNTVPEAFQESDAVIVHGHGVFCSGKKDFNLPFTRMLEIEHCCRKDYFEGINSVL